MNQSVRTVLYPGFNLRWSYSAFPEIVSKQASVMHKMQDAYSLCHLPLTVATEYPREPDLWPHSSPPRCLVSTYIVQNYGAAKRHLQEEDPQNRLWKTAGG